MPILFAISVLALVALLWAAVSAARHIRRARRRRQRSLGAGTVVSFPGRIGLQSSRAPETNEVSFEEQAPYTEAATLRPTALTPVIPAEEAQAKAPAPRVPMVMPEPPYVPAPAYVPKLTYAQVSPFVSVGDLPLVATEASLAKTVEPAPVRRSGLFSAARLQADEDGAVPVAPPTPQWQPENEPGPVARQLEDAPIDAPVPKKPSTALRPSARRLSLVANSGIMERPDWAYFNKDMGDLTDPYESPRTRPKSASGDSRR